VLKVQLASTATSATTANPTKRTRSKKELRVLKLGQKLTATPRVLAGQPAVSIGRLFWAEDDAGRHLLRSSVGVGSCEWMELALAFTTAAIDAVSVKLREFGSRRCCRTFVVTVAVTSAYRAER
jgi:hypothetical protein